jgi:hypothetical protein
MPVASMSFGSSQAEEPQPFRRTSSGRRKKMKKRNNSVTTSQLSRKRVSSRRNPRTGQGADLSRKAKELTLEAMGAAKQKAKELAVSAVDKAAQAAQSTAQKIKSAIK